MTTQTQRSVRKWTESAIQREFISMTRELSITIPQLSLIFAIPNGHIRHPATAARLKGEGVLAGIPDLMLPVPKYDLIGRIIKCGLWIEFKAPKTGQLSPQQAIIKEALLKNQYEYALCRSSNEALDIVLQYLNIDLWSHKV